MRWNRVLAVSIAVGAAVLLLRGCCFACAPGAGAGEPLPQPTAAAVWSQAVRVYDRSTGSTAEQPIEDYLVGVVAAEMPASFHAEALRAQAVAARTYTVAKRAHGGCNAHDADVCTGSNCCQAYASEARMRQRWGGSYEENYEKVRAAVMSTAGEVLLYAGEPIEALYHSASGGATEDSENVFAAARPYLRAVESAGETGTSRLTGVRTFSYEDLCKKVNAAYAEAGLSADRLTGQIAVLSRTDSGRVRSIRLGNATLTGKQLRYLLGLDSTLFTVTLTGKTVRFDTRGFGHGVGMSQTGANAMGQSGSTYREILLHYYTGVTIGAWQGAREGGGG